MHSILVAGSGCRNCQKLAQMCQEVVEENKLDAVVDKVTDLNQIAALGVMMTPGLIIDGKVVSAGKVPQKDELAKLIIEKI